AWSIKVVFPFQTDTGNIFHNIDKLVDGDKLTAAQVYWFADITFENGLRAIGAVIDVHEAACLLTIAPDFDLVISRVLGLEHFATDCCGGLFSSAVPRPVRAVDVVITRHTRLQSEIFFKVPAHAFGEELLPAVAVFRECWVSVFFFEG